MVSFASTDGSIIGSRYKSSAGWGNVNGSVLKGNYLVASVWSTYLMRVNVQRFDISIWSFNGVELYACAVESTGRYEKEIMI